MDTVTAELGREAMSRLAAGVVVVTSWVEGRPWGMTVTACCSVSMSPPTMLVSLRRGTVLEQAVRDTGCFGVALLGEDDVALAVRCASPAQDKFIDEHCDTAASGLSVSAGEVARRDGSPIVAGSLTHIDCTLTDTIDVADHTLVIGAIRAVHAPSDPATLTPPLVYFRQSFMAVAAHHTTTHVADKFNSGGSR